MELFTHINRMYGMDMTNSPRSESVDNSDLTAVSDLELTLRLKKLAADERTSLVILLNHLAEFDCRELYGPLGYPSMFIYCTKVLCFSEDVAYRRIRAERISRRFPEILAMLGSGELHLATIALLAPHLTEENRLGLLSRAAGKSSRDVAMMIAALVPQPEKADIVRRLSQLSTTLSEEPTLSKSPDLLNALASSEVTPPVFSSTLPPRIEPVAPDRIRFSFTGDEALLRKLERAREVLWHKYPAGKLEDIFEEALDLLLDRKDPERRLRKKSVLKRPDTSASTTAETRRIPQWVKDEVFNRDQGRCAFTAPDGTRCQERSGLEFDHIVPWALGGRSHDPGNIRLLCRSHNQIRARRMFAAAGVKSPPP